MYGFAKYNFMRRGFFSALLRPAIIIAAIVGLISCNSNTDENKTTTSETTVGSNESGSTNTMPENTNMPMQQHAEAILSAVYADTTLNGTVKFDADSSGKVTMKLDLNVPSKAGKSIAVHIHEHGDCADTAKAAHGHWNPTNAQHGKWGSSSFHVGDIGNVKLDSKGKGAISITTDLWTLGGSADKNIIGRSIIVHGGTDDYISQPTGNSGARIGCGVIK